MSNPDEPYLAQDAVMHMSMRNETTKKRVLVEVLAVRIVERTLDQLKRVRGVIMLRGSDQNHVIYEDFCHKSDPQFNSEGYFTLIGPERAVEVKDALIIYPWFFNTYNTLCGRNQGKIMWKSDPHFRRTNQVIRKGIACNVGVMEVDFAVYDDGVEACIEVSLLDLKLEGVPQLGKFLEIYGSVKASNSVIMHTRAKSTLFDHTNSREHVKLSPWPSDEAEISVPMTKSVTVIPRYSNLIVDVDLYVCCTLQGKSLAIGSVTFDARSRSSGTVEEKIILGTRAMVKVKAVWSS